MTRSRVFRGPPCSRGGGSLPRAGRAALCTWNVSLRACVSDFVIPMVQLGLVLKEILLPVCFCVSKLFHLFLTHWL